VEVKASCGDQACNVIAAGDLTNVKEAAPYNQGKVRAGLNSVNADLGPGETTTLKLKLSKKTHKKADKALDEGKKVQANVKVAVGAIDPPCSPRGCAFGHGWDAKRKITLVN
jgi:hypothetical protein